MWIRWIRNDEGEGYRRFTSFIFFQQSWGDSNVRYHKYIRYYHLVHKYVRKLDMKFASWSHGKQTCSLLVWSQFWQQAPAVGGEEGLARRWLRGGGPAYRMIHDLPNDGWVSNKWTQRTFYCHSESSKFVYLWWAGCCNGCCWRPVDSVCGHQLHRPETRLQIHISLRRKLGPNLHRSVWRHIEFEVEKIGVTFKTTSESDTEVRAYDGN